MEELIKKATTPKKSRQAAPKAAIKTAPETAKKKAAPMKKPHVMVSREEIARLAHQFWAERGRQHGNPEEDWFRAEQALHSKAS